MQRDQNCLCEIEKVKCLNVMRPHQFKQILQTMVGWAKNINTSSKMLNTKVLNAMAQGVGVLENANKISDNAGLLGSIATTVAPMFGPVGLGALGLGGAAYGAYKLYDHWKNKKNGDEIDEQTFIIPQAQQYVSNVYDKGKNWIRTDGVDLFNQGLNWSKQRGSELSQKGIKWANTKGKQYVATGGKWIGNQGKNLLNKGGNWIVNRTAQQNTPIKKHRGKQTGINKNPSIQRKVRPIRKR